MALNVSLILRAQTEQFKGQLRAAGDELREVGGEARAAGGSIRGTFSAAVGTAQQALGRLRTVATTTFASLRRGFRTGISQLGLQVQDIAVQLEAGVDPLRIFVQQGSQIAGAFGPAGAAIGAVLAVTGAVAAAFVSAGSSADEAAKATTSFKAAMEGLNQAIGDSIVGAGKIAEAYGGVSREFQRLGALDLERRTREQTRALEDQRAALEGIAEELEAAAERREFLRGITDIGGLAGALPSAEAVQELLAQFRESGDVIAFAEALQQLGASDEGLQSLADRALDAAAQLETLTAQVEETARAREAVAALATDGADELGRLQGSLQETQDEVGRTTEAFGQMYEDVVGNSIIPDMVTEVGSWFDRLGSEMGSKSEEAAAEVEGTFSGLNRSVSHELASMVTQGKLTLTDFASSAESILSRIFQRFLEAGLSSAFSGAGTTTATSGGGGGAQTMDMLHRGGVVGAPGAPKRSISAALFAGAERYHRGGTVLEPGEVPIVARRGERISQPGAADGGGSRVTVNVIDQRSGGELVETRRRRGPSGIETVDVIIRDRMRQAISRGDLDTVLAARFGTKPALGTR